MSESIKNQQPAEQAAAPQADATSVREQVSTFVDHTVQSGKDLVDQTVESGKKWIADSGVRETAGQVPQKVKDWGNRAVARVNNLSTTQKVVGGAILAAGLGWLALRRKAGSSDSEQSTSVYGQQKSGYARKASYGYQSPNATERHSSPSSSAASGYGSQRAAGSRYVSSANPASSVDRSSSNLDE